MAENQTAPTQNAVVTNAQPLSTNELVIGVNTDVSAMSMEQRVALFQRYSEAQAGTKIDDSLLNQELVATAMTVYQRDYIDQETGEIGLASYVAFTLADGRTFKTASSTSVPFALSVARFIGYDAVNGTLPAPIKFVIQPQKADMGFKYNFVFKGLAS